MSFIGTGIAIGNIAGALSASLGTALGIGALGSTAVGAGGIGALTAGSVLAGTAGTGLGALASGLGAGAAGATGSGAAEAAGAGATEAAGATTAAGASDAAGASTPSIAVSSSGGIAPGSVISAMGGTEGAAGTAVPASFGSGVTSTGVGGTGGFTAFPTAAAPTTLLSGGVTGMGHIGDWAASNVAQQGIGGINQSISNAQTQKESDKIHQQYFGGFGGFAHGGEVQHVARQGGSVKLRDGAFIVPADVVSALGNGSSKAGAKYLTHLCRMLEAGPPPAVGSIARSRARV